MDRPARVGTPRLSNSYHWVTNGLVRPQTGRAAQRPTTRTPAPPGSVAVQGSTYFTRFRPYALALDLDRGSETKHQRSWQAHYLREDSDAQRTIVHYPN